MIAISDVTDVLAKEIGSVLSWEKVEKLVLALHEIDDEWEPMQADPDKLGYTMSTLCPDICLLAQQVKDGYEIRFLRRSAKKEVAV